MSTAFRLMQRDGHGFLSHLVREEWRFLRRTMIGIVLATDMASHTDVVTEFSGGHYTMDPPKPQSFH